jgi:hypothetical protein
VERTRNILNWLINYPNIIVRLFTRHPALIHHYPESYQARYHALMLTNLERFLEYQYTYQDISDYILANNPNSPEGISENRLVGLHFFQNIRKIVVYGSWDWMIKPWKNNGKDYEHYLQLIGNVESHLLKGYGHILSKRFSLDANLNRQYCASKRLLNILCTSQNIE